MKSYVVRDGGDDYILNGQKTFITNGPDADVVVVYAKLNDDAPGAAPANPRDRKVLTFVLDRGMDGFVQSKPFRKMGIHSSVPESCSSTTSDSGVTGCSARPREMVQATPAVTVPVPTSPPNVSASRPWPSA